MKFHKNFHLVALFATMIALNAQAASVSSEQVCRAVSAWAAANGSAFAGSGCALSAEPECDADGTPLYYKVKMSNGGLVIASPDTDLDLVVAVLEDSDGTFPAGHPLPSILKKDMRNRLSIVRSAASSSGASGVRMASTASASARSASAVELPEDVKSSIRKSNSMWEKYGRSGGMRLLSAGAEESGQVVTNVLRVVEGFEKGGRFTHWNQEYSNGKLCYNYYTPGNEVCGCVATAGAAVMQFFGNGTDVEERGPVNDNRCSAYGQPIDCKTKPGAIDWSILPKSYGGNSDATELDEAGCQLLGRVTYNFGVLVGMAWASEGPGSGSGAYLSQLADAFKVYGFDSARAVTFNTLDEGTSQYHKMVYAQTWAGAPVVLGIQGESGAHAVVACGYARTSDDEELCRVFMGWGGSGDAWYKFPEVESYQVIDEAVTMIGYDATKSIDPAVMMGGEDVEAVANDMFNKYGTVPICGKINIANTKLTFPGVTKSVGEGEEAMSFTLTVSVDSNGFFAVRIPVDTKDLSIVHEASGTTFTISPFNSKVLKDDEKDRSEVEAAMPGDMLLLVLNTTVKSTVESARAKALEDGKAVLMVSGSGSVRENLLIDYIAYLDSTTDMSNKFVFVRLNSSDYSSVDGDGDPSIGIFDPTVGSAEGRWWEENGRLAYSNFIDYEADNLEDELKYLFTATDTSAFSNIVAGVIADGYDLYARRHSGIEVVVRAIDEAGNPMSGLGGVDLAYGVYTNCWTNGQVVVFSAPAGYTNETLGIAYKCLGWSTNGTDVAASLDRSLSVAISLSNSVDFVWMWKIVGYRVKASSDPAVEGAVTPAVSWVYPNDRVTLLAEPKLKGDGLAYWDIRSGVTDAEYSEAELGQYDNGRAVSFTVTEPLSVVATYKSSAPAAGEPEKYSVGIAVNPPELAGFIEGGSLKIGDNDTYDRIASVSALVSDIVDSTGGVWKCVGYIENGVTNSLPETGQFLTWGSPTVELAWEFQQPVEEEVLPEPGPISVKGLSRAADGSWRITVEGAVKDCWYWLYSSDDLSKLAGDSSQWTADLAQVKETNPQQAGEDGDIVFTVTSAEGKMFWRTKVTATESGEK